MRRALSSPDVICASSLLGRFLVVVVVVVVVTVVVVTVLVGTVVVAAVVVAVVVAVATLAGRPFRPAGSAGAHEAAARRPSSDPVYT
jgi:hypothetical protein